MGWVNRLMISRLERQVAAATDEVTRVEVDCRLAHRQLKEKRGEFPRLPWSLLAVAAFIGAFWLPTREAIIVAAGSGLWIGFREGQK